MKTEAARAAQMIRKELKANGIPARVKSENYSMGSSVRVYIVDALPATAEKIENYIKQHQYGRFKGMEDIYEYTNSREDIPQAKHVFLERLYEDETRQAAKDYVKNYFETDMGYDFDSKVHQVLNGSIKCNFWTERKPKVRTSNG